MTFSHGELAQMEQAAKNRADNSDRCVCCGECVPEGRMVCKNCEEDAMKIDIEQPEKVIEEFLRQIRNGELVNVVRCKDCKFRKPTNLHPNEWFCPRRTMAMYEKDLDGYCDEGERRKDK